MIGNQVLFLSLCDRKRAKPPFNENNRADFYLRGVYFFKHSSTSSNLKVSIKLVNGLKFENPGFKVGTAQHIVQVND